MAVDDPMSPAQLTPVLPLESAGSSWAPPSLPPTVPASETNSYWTVTRHVFAAAYPRTRVGSYVEAKANTSNETGSRLSGAEVQAQVAAMKEKQYAAPVQGEKESGHLWMAVNCYRSKRRHSAVSTSNNNSPGTTLILAHATGLHKETWEPALNRMAKGHTAKDAEVDEVWSLDLINQGDSAVLNVDHLGPSFDWMDVARDIANFVLQHLPQYSSNGENQYEALLPQLDVPSKDLLRLQSARTSPKYTGSSWRGRNVVLVGHSIGGASSISTCSFLPEGLVKGLILVDPTVQPLDIGGVDRVMPLVTGALIRRDLWSSRKEALAGFQKNKGFFGRWHPEALASYVDNALYQQNDSKLTLKTRRRNEAVTFLDPNLRGARACWNRLQHLPPSLRVHIILADAGASVIQTRGISVERLLNELAATAPTYQQVFGIDHMLVQENPQVAANTITQCLSSWFSKPSAKL